MKWREDGTRCTQDDNRRRWIPQQWWAGDAMDELREEKGELCGCDWERARVAQRAVDSFLIQMITTG